jgi:hypothetical protein
LIRATSDFADEEIRCARPKLAREVPIGSEIAYLGKPEVIGAQSERRDGTAPSVPM